MTEQYGYMIIKELSPGRWRHFAREPYPIAYRYSKSFHDRDSSMHLEPEEEIAGEDEGDGWLRVSMEGVVPMEGATAAEADSFEGVAAAEAASLEGVAAAEAWVAPALPPPEWLRFTCQDFYWLDNRRPSDAVAGLRIYYHAEAGHQVQFVSQVDHSWTARQGCVNRLWLGGYDYINLVFRWHADYPKAAHSFVRAPEDPPNQWRSFCNQRRLQLHRSWPL